MNLTFLKNFLARNDVKLLIMGTLTGGILQLAAREYLKRHPEFLNDASVTKEKYKLLRFLSYRGGARSNK